MTGMLGHPVAENPIDRMFDAVYAHYGLNWQFWKNDIAYFTFRQPRGKPLTGFGDVQIIDKVNAHRDVDYVCLHAGLSVLMENVQLINRPVIEVA